MKNDRFILNRISDVKVIYIGTGQFQLASGKWEDAILYKYRKAEHNPSDTEEYF